MWLKEEDVEEEVVEDGWGRDRSVDIIDRTSRCADKLKRWGRRKRMKFKKNVLECSEEMERLRGSQVFLLTIQKHPPLNFNPVITHKSSKGVNLFVCLSIVECLQAYG
jgi:hypothetical protein